MDFTDPLMRLVKALHGARRDSARWSPESWYLWPFSVTSQHCSQDQSATSTSGFERIMTRVPNRHAGGTGQSFATILENGFENWIQSADHPNQDTLTAPYDPRLNDGRGAEQTVVAPGIEEGSISYRAVGSRTTQAADANDASLSVICSVMMGFSPRSTIGRPDYTSAAATLSVRADRLSRAFLQQFLAALGFSDVSMQGMHYAYTQPSLPKPGSKFGPVGKEGRGTATQLVEVAPTGREVWRLDPRLRLATFHPAAICNPGMRVELDNVYRWDRDCALLARMSGQQEPTLDSSSLPPAISSSFRSWLFTCSPLMGGPQIPSFERGDEQFVELLPGETETHFWERRASLALSLFTLMGGFGKVQYIWVEGFEWKLSIHKKPASLDARIREQEISHTQKMISRSLWEVPSLLPAYNFSVSNLVRRGAWSSVSCDLKRQTSVKLYFTEAYKIADQNQRALNSTFVDLSSAVAKTNGKLRKLVGEHSLIAHKRVMGQEDKEGFTTAAEAICAQLFARAPSSTAITFHLENNRECKPTNLSSKLLNQFSYFGVNKGSLVDLMELRYVPGEPFAEVPREPQVVTQTLWQKSAQRLAQFFFWLMERFGFMRPMVDEHALALSPSASPGAVLAEQRGQVQLDNQLLTDPDVEITTFVNIRSAFDDPQDYLNLQVTITLPDLAPTGDRGPNIRTQTIALIEQLFQRRFDDSQNVPLRVETDAHGSKWTVSLKAENLAAVQFALERVLHAGEDDGDAWSIEHNAYGVQARSLLMLRQACSPHKRLAAASNGPMLTAEKDKQQQFIVALKSFLSNDFPANLDKVDPPAPAYLRSFEPKSAQHLLQMACLVDLVERGHAVGPVGGAAFLSASFTDIRDPARLSHAFCARAEKIVRSLPRNADVNSKLVVAQDLYDLVWKPLFREISSLYGPMMGPDGLPPVTPPQIQRNQDAQAENADELNAAADSLDAKLMSLQKAAFHLIRLYGDLLSNTGEEESRQDILQLFLDQDNEGQNKIILALAVFLNSQETTPTSETKKYDVSERMKEVVEILDPRYPAELHHDGFLISQDQLPRNIFEEVRELTGVVEALCAYLSQLDIYSYCERDPTHATAIGRRLTALTDALFATDLLSAENYIAGLATVFEENIDQMRRYLEDVKLRQESHINRRLTERQRRKIFDIKAPAQYCKGAIGVTPKVA